MPPPTQTWMPASACYLGCPCLILSPCRDTSCHLEAALEATRPPGVPFQGLLSTFELQWQLLLLTAWPPPACGGMQGTENRELEAPHGTHLRPFSSALPTPGSQGRSELALLSWGRNGSGMACTEHSLPVWWEAGTECVLMEEGPLPQPGKLGKGPEELPAHSGHRVGQCGLGTVSRKEKHRDHTVGAGDCLKKRKAQGSFKEMKEPMRPGRSGKNKGGEEEPLQSRTRSCDFYSGHWGAMKDCGWGGAPRFAFLWRFCCLQWRGGHTRLEAGGAGQVLLQTIKRHQAMRWQCKC